MKILYVCQYFPPEMGAPAARASELALHWTDLGHEVTILTGFPNHPTGVMPPEYRAKMRRFVAREQFGAARVVRTWLVPRPNRNRGERMLNYSSFCLSAAMAGTFICRPDVVIATSPQLLVGLSGWWLSRIKRVPFIFEVRDLWPESLAAVGVGSETSTLYRALAGISGFLYRASEHIIVVSPAFKDRIVTDWKTPEAKISVVENGVETDLFTPDIDDIAQTRRELDIQQKFVVSYIGTLGNAAGLETLLEAADLLREDEETIFLLVGEGAEKEKLLSEAQRRGLKNIRFLEQQPRAKIPSLIRASDVCTVLLRRADVFDTVIPTKMLEFMSTGRPIVLGVGGISRSIIDSAQAGIPIDSQDASALVDAVRRLKDRPELRREMGRNGRRHILQSFSRRDLAASYCRVLDSVINDRG